MRRKIERAWKVKWRNRLIKGLYGIKAHTVLKQRRCTERQKYNQSIRDRKKRPQRNSEYI